MMQAWWNINSSTNFAPFFFSQSSNLLNQARLKVLKAREEHVGNVLTDAKRQLGSITRDQQKYAKLLEGLIAQVKHKSQDYKERMVNIFVLGCVPIVGAQANYSLPSSRSRHCSKRSCVSCGICQGQNQDGHWADFGHWNFSSCRWVSGKKLKVERCANTFFIAQERGKMLVLRCLACACHFTRFSAWGLSLVLTLVFLGLEVLSFLHVKAKSKWAIHWRLVWTWWPREACLKFVALCLVAIPTGNSKTKDLIHVLRLLFIIVDCDWVAFVKGNEPYEF